MINTERVATIVIATTPTQCQHTHTPVQQIMLAAPHPNTTYFSIVYICSLTSTMIFSTTIRLVFISSLFLIFLLYFGYPSYRRFNKKDTVFIENQVPVDHTKPVMISIYAWKGISFNGWKDQPIGYQNLTGICNSTDEYDKMIGCIIDRTYEHKDIISDCTTGESGEFKEDIDVESKPTWMQGITKFSFGRFHSAKIYHTNEQAEQEWQINDIYLKSDKNYSLFIHDPEFFPFSFSPETTPYIFINMDDSRSQQVVIKGSP